MSELFRIETNQFLLVWSLGSDKDRPTVPGLPPQNGLLIVRPGSSNSASDLKTWRLGVPNELAHDPSVIAGPLLFEETDYQVYLKSSNGLPVRLMHRDPLTTKALREERISQTVYGAINFRGQVGHSTFTVLVGDKPALEFEVEVFPTKLDYQTDYRQLLAEVQEIMTGLALEYLRATFRLGALSHEPKPTQIEWLTLLKSVAVSLESSLRHITEHPIRGLTRESVSVRADQVKRVDESVRAAIRRGAGSGSLNVLPGGLSMRQRLDERRPRPTLDTAEHRWLASQVSRIRRRLGLLVQQLSADKPSDRRNQVLSELEGLEIRMSRLCRLEPLSEANGQPPPGFASLQLIGAPGYREAYQACTVLSLGLRLTGGIFQLSVKDIGVLYEYWCYLALLRVVAEETNRPLPAKFLFGVTQQGLQVLLEKGRATEVPFEVSPNRCITVTYNPKFGGNSMLTSQKPDMVVSIKDQDWPLLRLLLDAKYRLDASPEYVRSYGSIGPPEDALNVLHRYRDAILETDGSMPTELRKRTVVQAAAVFPYMPEGDRDFEQSRIWKSLEGIGIGAIPLLPANTAYLRQWLRGALRKGGWEIADQTIEHRTTEQSKRWRQAAADPVLIGTLSGGREAQHLQWIIDNRLYYKSVNKTQRREYAAKVVAIYSPSTLLPPGAITHKAVVEWSEVIKRADIATPWSPRLQSEELCMLYHLGPVAQLPSPIVNRGRSGRGDRFSTHRWTSRLGLDRARTIIQVLLETEPEWRLYESLTAAGLAFDMEPLPPTLLNADDPIGRVWFVPKNRQVKVRYIGDSGFQLRDQEGELRYFARVSDVVEECLQGT